MRILVIEDDPLTAEALTTMLTAHRYAVEVATDGKAGLALLDSFEYDLLILDVGLPQIDGIELCRQVRALGQHAASAQAAYIPILLLTARGSYHDRALGLDAGADDYMVKPFAEEELVARIRALLRRATAPASPCIHWGDLQLDPKSCEVSFRGESLALTPKEYALLELFLRNSRRVFSCSNIIEHLWAYEDAPGEEAVRTHIKGLRQKLKAAGATADLIETVYGIGYRLKPLKNSAASDAEGKTAGRSEGRTSTEQELRSKLALVWNRYKDRISEQIGVIEQVAAQPSTRILQRQAAQQAHTLAGALGTFGFAEGSRLAGEMEQILAGDRPLGPKLLKQLRELTAALRRGIDLPTTSLPTVCPEPAWVADTADLIVVASRDRPFLQALERELPQWNYQMAIASTPKAIAKICENDPPCLVVLDFDCFEPRDTAMEVLAHLQQQASPLSKFPIPVMMLASHLELPERLAVARRGGRLLLQKSTPMSQILESMTQLIQRGFPAQAKVLIVDDDTAILEALVALIKPWGLKVFTLADPHRLWDSLEAIAPDLLILDLEFPDLSGLELCQVIRSDPRWSQLPIVVLTAHAEAETVNQVFASGADDFIRKPIMGAELVAGILNRLERVKLLRQLLETDPLTGVANRQKSTQELEAFLHSAQQVQAPVAIAVLDVDRLRDVNANYGHAIGDAVLRQFGHLLRQSFAGEDVVARWGGEEFVIGMYGMTREDGVQRLINLLERLHRQTVPIETGSSLQVTFSAGVAQYPVDGEDVRSLYRAADAALRQAKRLRLATGVANAHSSILPADVKHRLSTG